MSPPRLPLIPYPEKAYELPEPISWDEEPRSILAPEEMSDDF